MGALSKHRLLDFDEVAEFLNVSRPTLYRLIRSGRLRSYKVGGRWKFRPEEIEAFLAARSNIPSPPAHPGGDSDTPNPKTQGAGAEGSDDQ